MNKLLAETVSILNGLLAVLLIVVGGIVGKYMGPYCVELYASAQWTSLRGQSVAGGSRWHLLRTDPWIYLGSSDLWSARIVHSDAPRAQGHSPAAQRHKLHAGAHFSRACGPSYASLGRWKMIGKFAAGAVAVGIATVIFAMLAGARAANVPNRREIMSRRLAIGLVNSLGVLAPTAPVWCLLTVDTVRAIRLWKRIGIRGWGTRF